ncbi:hypothetical protein [Rhizobium sp. BR 362]|uniref:hypothetical protein n=1 Tax=Rhizobium sp. BR 362 TaxID=3040670 RepID=UPI002F3FD04E
MLIKTIFSAVFFTLIGLGVSACSTTGQGNSSGGSGGMTRSSPAGGSTSGGGMGGGY